MESLCSQCARLSIVRRSAATQRVYQRLASFSTVQSHAKDSTPDVSPNRSKSNTNTRTENKGEARPVQPGRSIADALKGGQQTSASPRKPIIRRYATPDRDNGGQTRGNTTPNTSGSSTGGPVRQVLQRTPPKDGAPVLRRTQNSGAPFLRRTGESQGGQAGARPGRFGTNDGRNAPAGRGRPGQSFGARGKGPGGRGPGGRGPDKRRTLAPKQEEDNTEMEGVEQKIENQLKNEIDRPANPTTFLPYDPEKISLDNLRADWPNTPLSTAGMTESVVQKIEWLARRLPHGYQSPEQIAEHYLKGNLTRFESDTERDSILKLASELSAKTKADAEAGTLHKHELPRFPSVDSAFTSLSTKSTEKTFLVETGVKGDYDNIKQPELPLLQSAARVLSNNETYGPIQAQRFLKRIEALMPQARAADGRAKGRAKRA